MTDETTPKSSTTEKTPITMSDGRIVEFNKKQKLVKTSSIVDGEFSTRLDFVNGETRLYTPRSDMLARLAAHGAEQKLGDAIAGETDIGDAVLAVDDVLARLNDGEWTVTRATGSFTGTSMLLQALIEASGKDAVELKAYLVSKTPQERTAIGRSDKLRPIMDRLAAAKAANSKNVIDTDSLLGELGLSNASAKVKRVSETA